jgi:hypothetical protein
VEIYGKDSSGFVVGWLARPAMRGRYTPIEILWDPISKVRDWGPWKDSDYEYDAPSGGPFTYRAWAGTERGRDFLTRRCGVYGYALFTFTTGCLDADGQVYDANHRMPTLPGGAADSTGEVESGHRPNTKHLPMHTSNKPSAWIAACHTPIDYWNYERYYSSHFGYRQTSPGWRFNAVHLDGHVHDAVFQITNVPIQWWDCRPKDMGYGSNDWKMPYGWIYVDNDLSKGVKTMGLDTAFDED